MLNDFDKMYIENERLVYKFATKYKLLNDEDMMQNLKMAMFRAITKFDPSRGIALSTYVYIALFHEYKYSFRDKHLKLSFVDNVVSDGDNKESDIFDFIADERNVDIDYELDKHDILNKIYKYLDENEEKYKQMFLDYYLNGIKQRQLADKYGLSQAQVSRKLKTIIKSLQELLKDYY